MDNKSLLLALRNGQKRLAYATVNALNTAAAQVQQDEFANVRSKFTIREDRVFFGSPGKPGGVAAKLFRASVKKAITSAELDVGREAEYSHSTGERKQGFILAMFERGGTRSPRYGARSLAVPITGGARPTKQSRIAREFTFSAMQLRAYEHGRKVRGRGRKGSRGLGVLGEYGRLFPPGGSAEERRAFGLPVHQYRGRNRTFLLTQTRTLPFGGVFQRVGKNQVRLLWKFQPSIPIDARLGFLPLTRAKFNKYFRDAFHHETILALSHARFTGAGGERLGP
jgi:hypothetical protein